MEPAADVARLRSQAPPCRAVAGMSNDSVCRPPCVGCGNSSHPGVALAFKAGPPVALLPPLAALARHWRAEEHLLPPVEGVLEDLGAQPEDALLVELHRVPPDQAHVAREGVGLEDRRATVDGHVVIALGKPPLHLVEVHGFPRAQPLHVAGAEYLPVGGAPVPLRERVAPDIGE
eukprot:scaffold39838_cov70-Phaeocystis_antarctica.AAC.11